MYHLIEGLAFAMTCLVVYAGVGPLKASYQNTLDIFGNWQVDPEMGAIWLFIPCMLLAIFFHPSMNKVPKLNST